MELDHCGDSAYHLRVLVSFNLQSVRIKIESFILPDKKIFFLKEEISQFPEITSSLKNILAALNNRLDFYEISLKEISDLNREQGTLLTILPQQISVDSDLRHKVLLIDKGNPWGRFEFFERYLRVSKFLFDKKNFRQMILNNDGFHEMSVLNRKLSFLPFKIARYGNKGISRYFPWIVKKDFSYFKHLHSAKYCSDYRHPRSFKEKFVNVVNRLNDEPSKETYRTVIYAKAEDIWKQYFNKAAALSQYSDYIRIDASSTIINCGVDFGTEIPLFLLNKPKKIYHIDPSGDTHLSNYVRKFAELVDTEHVFIKKALYNNENVYKTAVQFNATTLVEVIEEYKINRIDLVKSDIEGAERYMLDDLIHISKKFRAQLAISIYHTNHLEQNFALDDLVDIPLKLMEKLEDYRFYVAHYCYERWEIILYGIPIELS